MESDYLNHAEHQNIRLFKMIENNNDLPFFITKYSLKRLPLDLHRHEYMQINYVYQGNIKHIINDHEFEVIKGDIFVIPPYVPHGLTPSDSQEAEIIEFEFLPEFVNQNFGTIQDIKSFFDFAYLEPFLVTDSQVKPRLNLSGKIQMEVENILHEALKEYDERKSGFELLIRSLLLKLLVLVGREFQNELKKNETDVLYSRHREAIYKTLEYIDKNYYIPLKIEDVSKVAMFSQSYFSYLFKSITSKTFIEYLNQLRILKAMELLKTTDKRVLDICYEVGYNNVNNFNRLFRQQTGTSPLVYRKKVNGK